MGGSSMMDVPFSARLSAAVEDLSRMTIIHSFIFQSSYDKTKKLHATSLVLVYPFHLTL
jgi:hypothetical protein